MEKKKFNFKYENQLDLFNNKKKCLGIIENESKSNIFLSLFHSYNCDLNNAEINHAMQCIKHFTSHQIADRIMICTYHYVVIENIQFFSIHTYIKTIHIYMLCYKCQINSN